MFKGRGFVQTPSYHRYPRGYICQLLFRGDKTENDREQADEYRNHPENPDRKKRCNCAGRQKQLDKSLTEAVYSENRLR